MTNNDYKNSAGYKVYVLLGQKGWLYVLTLWALSAVSAIILDDIFYLFGGKGRYLISPYSALMQALGFSILVPISTSLAAIGGSEADRKARRMFRLFFAITLLQLLVVTLNNLSNINS